MSKPWGNIGTWAAEAEREEQEMAATAAAAPPPDTKSYPSLREAVTTKPKKKKMSLNEFYSVSAANTSAARQSKGLTPDEMVRLPTGPRERGPDEMQQPRGFNSYGSREEYSGGGGGGRRQYGGGYDDDQRRGGGGLGSSRVSDYDQVSRADEADNWSMGKKALPSMDSGRQSRYGSLGSGGGGASRADEVDNWAVDKKPLSFATPSRSSNFGFRSSGAENDRWTRSGSEVEQERPERPRLVLNPPKVDVGVTVTEVSKTNKPNPFGTARPREEVLAEKGLDWRKLETDLESKKTSSHSSAHSSRPSSAQSGRSETVVPAGLLQQGLENVMRPAKPKVNPFGDAKPREVLLQERGQDWRKMDRELEHRSIDRPETEEEKLLKEEINKLKEDVQKEAVQVSDGDQSSINEIISQKEKELETLIRDLDDKVRFRQKPLSRPGSGAGRTPAFSDRPPSRSGSVDESRNTEFLDRPRSRGAPDILTRPVDERRSFQGGRGQRGFLASCHVPAVYNFGDSNSDTGSQPAIFGRVPFPNGQTFFGKPSGRYSDGRMIIDFLTKKLGLPYLSSFLDSLESNFTHGANFASSGATVQPPTGALFDGGFNPVTFEYQVLQFQQLKDRTFELRQQGLVDGLPKPEEFKTAMYMLDCGQNDLHFGLAYFGHQGAVSSIPFIINNFSLTIERLYDEGARTFWIHNTGPIGCLPFFVMRFPPKPEDADPVGCIKSYNEVATEFNTQLNATVYKLRAKFPDALMVLVDMYSAKYSLIRDANEHGFEDPLGFCCGHLGEDYEVECGRKVTLEDGTVVHGTACKDPSKYISWDNIHYTEAANRWVADRISDGSMSDPPISIGEACSSVASEYRCSSLG
ncbi:Eukaryotic translation initiation factor 4B1 [Linum grandiflorum]